MRFSIVITCYNQFSFIQAAVESALNQRGHDKEIIVVDDCSTDGSRELLKNYGGAITFEPLTVNAGPAEARNAGASRARGEFLVFLDGDDLLLPWALHVYERIVKLKAPKLILSRMHWFKGTFSLSEVGPEPHEVRFVEYEAFMKKDRPYRASASALVIDRMAFNQVNAWTKGIFPMDDHDLLLKLGFAGKTVHILSPPTAAYRVHTSNIVHQFDRMITGLSQLIEREKLGIYPGGRQRRVYRLAILGGLVLFVVKRGIRHRLYFETLKLFRAGWRMILFASFLRCLAFVQGKKPVETLRLEKDAAP